MAALVVIIISILSFSVLSSSVCPCSDAALCKNIQTNYSKELYGFLPGGNLKLNDTSQYNWTYITAFAVGASTEAEELMCEAHKHGVRMIYWIPGSFPFTDDLNVTMAWIQNLFNTTTSLYYDGVTFDYEGAMLWNEPHSAQYVHLINLTTQYFHKHLPGSTTSVCVPFSAYLEWGRQYDYYNLALAADYLYIMDYDVQTQIFDSQCIAKAVSPYETTKRGVQSYLNLGIAPNKLILGIPWYGRMYKCILEQMEDGMQGHYCPIIPAEQRGVNCTGIGHAQSGEVSYASIMNYIFTEKYNTTEVRWDNTMKTHYINVNIHTQHNQYRQIWWDDPESLMYKYVYAKSMGLRGLGPFQFGDLIWDQSDAEKKRAQEMWSVFDVFYQANTTNLSYSFYGVNYAFSDGKMFWKYD